MDLQRRLDNVIKDEDFEQAARLRDELSALVAGLEPLASLELHHVQRLQAGTLAEQQESLKILAEMSSSQDTVAILAGLLHNEHLVNDAEEALQRVWHRHPSSLDINDLMAQGSELLRQSHTYEGALAVFDKVVQLDPAFAEGWNKRATIKYLLHRFEESIADCEETIRLQPYHFGAMSGKGLCHIHLHQYTDAIACFEAALAVHPHLSQIQRYCKALKYEHAAE